MIQYALKMTFGVQMIWYVFVVFLVSCQVLGASGLVWLVSGLAFWAQDLYFGSGVWICLVGVWIHLLGVRTCILGIWTCILVSGLVYLQVSVYSCGVCIPVGCDVAMVCVCSKHPMVYVLATATFQKQTCLYIFGTCDCWVVSMTIPARHASKVSAKQGTTGVLPSQARLSWWIAVMHLSLSLSLYIYI